MESKRRVIIDVDVGTDDYLALLIFFHAEKMEIVKIEGIVCTMGNTTVDNVCVNVVRLLEIVGRTDIPVFRGATRQLIPPEDEIPAFHGTDGFGDLHHDREPDLSIIKKEPAAVAMRNIVVNNPNEITLICLAALTNVALALRLFDDFASNVKDLWIMGGNYTAKGNVTATAEYNFYIDPEAAYMVLEAVPRPIYILTWEACLSHEISFDWRFNVFGIKDNPAIRLLNEVERKVYTNWTFWLPCDAYLAAAFVYPSIIVQQTVHNATVELHGFKTRGQIVLDHLKKKKENIIIIEIINQDKFSELLLEL